MFAVLKAAKQLKTKDRADVLYDLIAIACAPQQDQKYIDALREMYRNIRDDAVPEFKVERARTDESGNVKLPWKQATQVMLQQMAVMKRVNGGG